MNNHLISENIAVEESTGTMFEFLKKVPLFSNLEDEDLQQLCSTVSVEFFAEDQILFIEGEIGEKAFVIMEGEIEILKESGGRTILLATHHAGAVIGEMSLLHQAPRNASGRTKTDCKLLAISHEYLDRLLDTSPSAARVMLSTISNRLQTTEIVLRQSEKMAQLGTLTAGIAHELNNPASAARRGSEHLRSTIELILQFFVKFQELRFSNEQWGKINELSEDAKIQASQPANISTLERSDREEEIEIWLEEHDVGDSWELAPSLVSMGYCADELDQFDDVFNGSQLRTAIEAITTIFKVFSLMEEIHQGTSRIGEIVKSLKSYVYLDQAPVQLIDIHEGLDNTLVMLRSKFKSGIIIEKEYAQDIPRIQAHGSELNQVWTNIIDNAIYAMDGDGKLTIRTKMEDDWVRVEIIDSGPGIPKNVQQKLFSPFFTTKPMGKGTGLGLNISFNIIQKHKGDIYVISQPGKTSFSVLLPINFEDAENGKKPLKITDQNSDERLREMLQKAKNIAVVGISNKENSPSHTVPRYLQYQGYKIFPINPNYDQVLGEKSYSDLTLVEPHIDIVLIFRQSNYVSEIVDQAIKIGTEVVWMQEGIINLEALSTAESAGLDVVMDTCIRKTHQRLFGSS